MQENNNAPGFSTPPRKQSPTGGQVTSPSEVLYDTAFRVSPAGRPDKRPSSGWVYVWRLGGGLTFTLKKEGCDAEIYVVKVGLVSSDNLEDESNLTKRLKAESNAWKKVCGKGFSVAEMKESRYFCFYLERDHTKNREVNDGELFGMQNFKTQLSNLLVVRALLGLPVPPRAIRDIVKVFHNEENVQLHNLTPTEFVIMERNLFAKLQSAHRAGELTSLAQLLDLFPKQEQVIPACRLVVANEQKSMQTVVAIRVPELERNPEEPILPEDDTGEKEDPDGSDRGTKKDKCKKRGKDKQETQELL